MIDNEALRDILINAPDISTVCELYASDAVPTVDGFDPGDAIACYAAVDGISFMGVEYERRVRSFGNISRTIGAEVNTASVSFSNIDRQMAAFEFTHGFEGLILVIRLLSRSRSAALTDSQILFAGRCEKPKGGDKDALTVSAKFILGGLDVKIPRRKFKATDDEGRPASNPEFEGFQFMPQYGTVSYSERVKKSFLWIFRWTKTVRHTLQYSSFSDLDANKDVPEVFGRVQVLGTHIGYIDVGTSIQMLTAWAEGEVHDITNQRSIQPSFPLGATFVVHKGEVGTANGINNSWVAPGYYSRTAYTEADAVNTAVQEDDPAPEIAAVVWGRLMKQPDATGDWDADPAAWSDNAAAITRFLLTSPDYFKLHENWIDDDYFTAAFRFNSQFIFNTAIDDFLFVEEG